MNVALIPARGGSKGIPKKNIKHLSGHPLIAWSITQALKAQCIDRVIVSTDDSDIASIAERYGAEVPFFRPEELSNDTATTESVMIHALEFLETTEGISFGDVILLQPTSPLRLSSDIDKAYDIYKSGRFDSLLSVCHLEHFSWRLGSSLEADYDYQKRPRRQDIAEIEKRFLENGSIYVSKAWGLKESECRLFGLIGHYLMNDFQLFEIDTESDWVIVEALMKKYMGNLC